MPRAPRAGLERSSHGRRALAHADRRPSSEDSAERRVGAEPHRVGWVFIALYASAYIGTCLVLVAPLLVTLALKVDAIVGRDQAPNSLALVTGVGALAAMLGNPFFGKLSDRTSGRGACGDRGWSSACSAVPSAS